MTSDDAGGLDLTDLLGFLDHVKAGEHIRVDEDSHRVPGAISAKKSLTMTEKAASHND